MSNYPDWILLHKKKGTYINKVGDKYYLYAAHSDRIKGTDKVRRVSDGYLGRITEKEGLIPPREKVKGQTVSYEFGFSYAILSCTTKIHAGLRKSFVKNGDLYLIEAYCSSVRLIRINQKIYCSIFFSGPGNPFLINQHITHYLQLFFASS